VGTKLYVGSLPYSTTEQELQELFAQHGSVQSAKVITDRFTGQSRGFGFVEMATAEDAQQAITALNGTPLGERTLVVNEARPQEKRSFSGGGGGGGDRNRWQSGSQRPANVTTVSLNAVLKGHGTSSYGPLCETA